MGLILVNNELLNDEEAMISVKDRGFRFGDGIFETMPFYNKVIYRADDHLERLKNGLESINIEYSLENFKDKIKYVIDANDIENGFARICITRGQGSRGYLPTYKTDASLVIEIVNRAHMESPHGDLIISPYKKIPLECLPVNNKLMNGLNYSLAKEDAKKQNYFDGILLTLDEKISECASSNIFWIKGETLFTPSLKTGAVAGVTRKAIMELSHYEVVEGEFNFLKLSGADEIFITNVTVGIFPIEKVAPTIFKNGKGYKKTTELKDKYLQDIFNKTGVSVSI